MGKGSREPGHWTGDKERTRALDMQSRERHTTGQEVKRMTIEKKSQIQVAKKEFRDMERK